MSKQQVDCQVCPLRYTGVCKDSIDCPLLGLILTSEKKKDCKFPSYCRACFRKRGIDPYTQSDCNMKEGCEHYSFRGRYEPPKEKG